jgi:hypothetical protein
MESTLAGAAIVDGGYHHYTLGVEYPVSAVGLPHHAYRKSGSSVCFQARHANRATGQL